MAKLNKTGTTIIWRMEREMPIDDVKENGASIERYALRSDGVLLSKLVVVRPDYRHDYGWKVARKGVSSESVLRLRLEAQGYARSTD